jgi:hypothetical protein
MRKPLIALLTVALALGIVWAARPAQGAPAPAAAHQMLADVYVYDPYTGTYRWHSSDPRFGPRWYGYRTYHDPYWGPRYYYPNRWYRPGFRAGIHIGLPPPPWRW